MSYLGSILKCELTNGKDGLSKILDVTISPQFMLDSYTGIDIAPGCGFADFVFDMLNDLLSSSAKKDTDGIPIMPWEAMGYDEDKTYILDGVFMDINITMNVRCMHNYLS